MAYLCDQIVQNLCGYLRVWFKLGWLVNVVHWLKNKTDTVCRYDINPAYLSRLPVVTYSYSYYN